MKNCFVLLVAAITMFACGASPQSVDPEQTTCGYPVGCYCSSNGLFIDADGQPSTMNGMPINCIPTEHDVGNIYPPVTKKN